MLSRTQLDQRLEDLGDVLESLEQMNLHHEAQLPISVSRHLHELGIVDQDRLGPAAVIPIALEQQQVVRRRLGSPRRRGPAGTVG